jgi:hypothetical protein
MSAWRWLVLQFSQADLNGDGQIDQAEFLTLAGRLLRENIEAAGRTFDLQQYEQECKEQLANEGKTRVRDPYHFLCFGTSQAEI